MKKSEILVNNIDDNVSVYGKRTYYEIQKFGDNYLRSNYTCNGNNKIYTFELLTRDMAIELVSKNSRMCCNGKKSYSQNIIKEYASTCNLQIGVPVTYQVPLIQTAELKDVLACVTI